VGLENGIKHALGDGAGLDGIGQFGHLRREGVGGGIDALIGLEMEPLPCVGAEKVDLKVELGVVEEEVWGERVHSLPSELNEISATLDRGIDRIAGIGAVSPMPGSVRIPQGEGEDAGAVVVQSVYRHLAAVGNGRCLQGEAKEEKGKDSNDVFHD
tara:strand:- start:105 stop:572 length:468 start_codon:yes stop_codon:yes gene_type:complete